MCGQAAQQQSNVAGLTALDVASCKPPGWCSLLGRQTCPTIPQQLVSRHVHIDSVRLAPLDQIGTPCTHVRLQVDKKACVEYISGAECLTTAALLLFLAHLQQAAAVLAAQSRPSGTPRRKRSASACLSSGTTLFRWEASQPREGETDEAGSMSWQCPPGGVPVEILEHNCR